LRTREQGTHLTLNEHDDDDDDDDVITANCLSTIQSFNYPSINTKDIKKYENV